MGIFGCSNCKDIFSVEKNNEVNDYNDRKIKLDAGNNENIINIENNKESESNYEINKKENESEQKIEIQIEEEDKNNVIEIRRNESNESDDIPADNNINNNNIQGNLPVPLDDSRDEEDDEKNKIYEIIQEDENNNN